MFSTQEAMARCARVCACPELRGCQRCLQGNTERGPLPVTHPGPAAHTWLHAWCEPPLPPSPGGTFLL